MAILKIHTYPDPILRKKCRSVKKIGPEEKKLFKDMAETMSAARGVGLAAPQVGIDRQLIIVDTDNLLVCLANPKILEKEGKSTLEEGCLSLPGIKLKVKRAKKVVLQGISEQGKRVVVEGNGLFAHALQHEIDHLKGRLIIDYPSIFQKIKLYPCLKKLKKSKGEIP